MNELRRMEKRLADEAKAEAARDPYEQQAAENAQLKARVDDLEAGIESITVTATEAMEKAQPVLDAADAWYDSHKHTDMAAMYRARTALVKAIRARREGE